MDAAQALAELRELSSQVERAVVLGPDDSTLASTEAGGDGTERLRRAGLDLVDAAAGLNATRPDVLRVDVELADGSVFVVRERGRTIVATTSPHPTTGLVVYDLRTCLHRIEDPKPARKRDARKEASEE